ncbi:hypothetical protein pb186bvf_003487 [Paramecium bursaria]
MSKADKTSKKEDQSKKQDQAKKQAQLAKKQAQKAKQRATQGKRIRKTRVHFQNRFHREKPLALERAPKFTRHTRQLKPLIKFDPHSIIKNPLLTEKDMKKMEDENTMVFIVDTRATKPQIKKAFEKLHEKSKVRSVNTLNTFNGVKKAYIRLAGDQDALALANAIGVL